MLLWVPTANADAPLIYAFSLLGPPRARFVSRFHSSSKRSSAEPSGSPLNVVVSEFPSRSVRRDISPVAVSWKRCSARTLSRPVESLYRLLMDVRTSPSAPRVVYELLEYEYVEMLGSPRVDDASSGEPL